MHLQSFAYRVVLGAIGWSALLWACGRQDLSHLSEGNSRTVRKEYWREMAPLCAGYPAKANCIDGDMALFSGLLCAAGEDLACTMVRDSQDIDGRWWRSPRRNPGNLGESQSFSRDMSLGVLLYLVTSHDVQAAQRWLDWIVNNRACLVNKPLGGCLVRGPYRFCRDDHNGACTMTPGNWALLGRVWSALGLEPSEQMRLASGLDSAALLLQAKAAPLGYEAHLPAVEVLLKQQLNADDRARAKAAVTLAERQPQNPFFVYLRDGASSALQQRLLSLCPGPASPSPERNQWAWERATDEQAWRNSMGWDCLFMAKLSGL